MKFTVSSSELLRSLLSVSRVIASKNTLPILDNFLLILKNNTLEITASDLEITLHTSLTIEDVEKEGELTLSAKLLLDSLKEFPDIPLCFEANRSEHTVTISWQNGEMQIPFISADDYPVTAQLDENIVEVKLDSSILATGINNTLYATADEPLRPVMNGVLFDLNTDGLTIVGSDAHKLICYQRDDIKVEEKTSFILPKKPANILKSILAKGDYEVTIKFDMKNAVISFGETNMTCRLVEGRYPDYRTVVPKNNHNRLTINRLDILNASKRVAVCSNQATSHVKLQISFNELDISAQDLSFSIAGHEAVPCQYDGDNLTIGFKSAFLIEILSNLSSNDVVLEFSDSTRAALITPAERADENESIVALLMPILINA